MSNYPQAEPCMPLIPTVPLTNKLITEAQLEPDCSACTPIRGRGNGQLYDAQSKVQDSFTEFSFATESQYNVFKANKLRLVGKVCLQTDWFPPPKALTK